jgi:effector-binding domain-containing protein
MSLLLISIKFNDMLIKEVKPINFLFFRAETKVNELFQFLPVGQDLYEEATKNKLSITGPIHWHYFGFMGDETKPFTLEISLPVSEVLEEYDGKFHFKRTEPFKCIAAVHEGAWQEIPKSYETLFRFMTEKKLQPLAANREIYVNVDFRNPEANTTEIQIGVK